MIALYKTGPVDYISLELIYFSDFLIRLDLVKRIIESDKNLLLEFKAKRKKLLQKKAELEEQRNY